jgi:hypothetical protein
MNFTRQREKIRSVDINVMMILGGLLIILFDLVYNLLQESPSIDYPDRIAIALGFCCILFGVAQEKILTIFRKIGELFESKPYHILFIIIIISILIRLLFLPERWINPDEGAHLYDAKFVLEGKIPFVDYDSRMPVYVYAIAAFLKVFGCNYMSGRLLPLFCNIGIGILVFLIGDKLFNSKKIALLASAIYLFAPLSILWSVVVKTELPETLFVCIGMFLLLVYIKEEKHNLIFFSGIFFALAYYVRRSAFVILVAALMVIILVYRRNIYKIVKTYGVMLLGYFSVVFIIFVCFSTFMGFTATWESGLNPLDTVMEHIQKITNILDGAGPVMSHSTDFRSKDQPFCATIGEWNSTLKLNSFLGICMILSLAILLYYFIKRAHDPTFSEIRLPYIFLYCWFFLIFLFYMYYTAQRGFFNQYFGELVPPLAIIASHAVCSIASNRQIQKKIKVFIAIILLTSFISSFCYINPSFGCVWSPETVKETSHYLVMNSDGDVEIMSGAVIWSFESNTRPFLNITHPLGFRATMSKEQIDKVEKQISVDPPRFIILDGYTEQTYMRHVPKISDTINELYSVEKQIDGSKYPVQIYELKRDVK